MDMGFPAERAHFCQAPIKLAQPFPAPESQTNNFTDTRIFLILVPLIGTSVPCAGGGASFHCLIVSQSPKMLKA